MRGIEDEQARLLLGDGGAEPLDALGQAEPGFQDHRDGQRGEGVVPRGGEGGQALHDDGGRILGGEEQDRAGGGHGEAPERRLARGDGDGQVEGQETLARFRHP
jgi:hypothetical protein